MKRESFSSPEPLESVLSPRRPRIDLHRLAQIVESSPAEARRLVRAGRAGGAPATRLFAEALRLGWDDDLLMSVALERWWGDSESSSGHRIQSMAAVESFSRLLEPLDSHLTRLGAFVRAADPFVPVEIGGVEIDDPSIVRLERVSHGQVGLLSFHVSRSRPHTAESMRQAATLLWALARANPHPRAELAPGLCLVVDVFGGRIIDADRDHRIRLWQAELACNEIAAIWSSLSS